MLFHYHIWTPYVEETEDFYKQLGFQVTQRIGKANGEFTSFNPPLEWDDFRERDIRFRIIEMKRGGVNLTFGHGKKVMFDHLGFFVSESVRQDVLDRATDLGLTIQTNDRRTFIQTPYGFRIELQTHADALEMHDETRPLHVQIEVKRAGLDELLSQLFQRPIREVIVGEGEHVRLKQVVLNDRLLKGSRDPNGIDVSSLAKQSTP